MKDVREIKGLRLPSSHRNYELALGAGPRCADPLVQSSLRDLCSSSGSWKLIHSQEWKTRTWGGAGRLTKVLAPRCIPPGQRKAGQLFVEVARVAPL